VVDIDHITQEVKIRFNIDDDEADEDSEYFPYLSTSLHWVEKVLTSSSNDVSDHHDVENAKTNSSIAVDVNNNNIYNNNNLSVVEIMNKEPTNISKLIPSSIDDAIGWEVDIDSTDPDAKPGDVHCGKVISIDRNNGKVRIKFDIDDDNIDDDDDDADDYEDISFNSSTIHWIRHDAT